MTFQCSNSQSIDGVDDIWQYNKHFEDKNLIVASWILIEFNWHH